MGVRISEMNPASTLTGTELVEVVQDGATRRTTVSALSGGGGGGGTDTYVFTAVTVDNGVDADSFSFNASVFNKFRVQETLSESGDVTYVDGVFGGADGYLLFATAGTYKISVRMQITPISPAAWPSGFTLYGASADGTTIARFTRSATEPWVGSLTDMVFTSEIVVTATGAEHINLGVFVDSYFTSSSTGMASMQVSVQRLTSSA